MDRQLHRDARAALAGRVSSKRPRRSQGDGRDAARECAARERTVAPMAFVRRHSPVEQGMNTVVYFDRFETPLGAMLLATDGVALVGAWFEGQRFFDIRRWKIAGTVMPGKVYGITYKDTNGDVQTIEVPGWTQIWDDKNYLWPIPQKEIELNSNLTQNAGW